MHRLCLLAGVLMAATLLAGCGGEKAPPEPKIERSVKPGDAPTRALLQYLPRRAPLAIATPSLNGFANMFDLLPPSVHEKVSRDVARKNLSNAFGIPPQDNLAELFSSVGIDPDGPGAVFLVFGQGGAVNQAWVATVGDEALLRGKSGTIAERLGFYVEIVDNRLFMANTADLLDELKRRHDNAARIAYGTAAFPGDGDEDTVVLLRLDKDWTSFVGTTPLADSKKKTVNGILEYLAGTSDELVLAMNPGGTPLSLRLAAHDAPPAPEAEQETATPAPAPEGEPRPLTGHVLFPQTAPLLANLRLTPGLIGFAGALAEAVMDAGKDEKRYINMAKTLLDRALGEELAAGVTGMTEGVPDVLVYGDVAELPQLQLVLTLLGMKKPPLRTIGEVPMYEANKGLLPVSGYIAVNEEVLVAGNGEQTVAGATETWVNRASAEAHIPAELIEAGENGFLRLSGAHASPIIKELAGAGFPAWLDLSSQDLLVTLQREGEWASTTLSVRNGSALLHQLAEMLL